MSTPNPDRHTNDDTTSLRERAVAVLQSLQDAKRRCDRQLSKTNRTDAMERVTGRSSLDEAIASAKRTIDVIDRAAADAISGNGPSIVVSGRGVREHETIAL